MLDVLKFNVPMIQPAFKSFIYTPDKMYIFAIFILSNSKLIRL